MAGELSAAITQIESLLATISGFNAEPATVPDEYSDYPFYVVEPDGGTIHKEAASQVRGLHGISIQIHYGLPATITPSDRSQVRLYVDLVKDKLLLDANNSLSGTVDTVEAEPLTYTNGLIGYRGLPTVGLEFILTVKIRSAESGGAYVKG